MRRLIFSDLHANIFAFKKMLRLVEALKAEALFSLGDVIGYNSYPGECLALMRENEIPSLTGNHEAMIVEELTPESCKSERGQNAVRVSRELLSVEEREEIRRWPLRWEFNETCLAWHAAFDSLYRTVNTVERARPQFEELSRLQKDICFFGHTHRPGLFIQNKQTGGVEYDVTLQKRALTEENRYLINPGTLGEPRHGLPMSFVMFDDRAMTVEYHVLTLSEEEKRQLRKNNRDVFGVTSLSRLPKQIREKGRRWYYRLGGIKDALAGAPSKR